MYVHMQVQVGLIIVNLVSGVEETVITTNKRSISNLPEEKQFTVYRGRVGKRQQQLVID